MSKNMRPYDAKTIGEVCQLQRDNYDAGDFWILTDGYEVSLAEQEVGSYPSQKITVPRAMFNRMVSWYMREQKLRRPLEGK